MGEDRSERRRSTRQPVWFPLEIDGGQKEGVGISFDASDNGMLVGSLNAFAPGDALTLRFRLRPEDTTTHEMRATVVRYEQRLDAPFWTHRLAVRFDKEAPALLMSHEGRLGLA